MCRKGIRKKEHHHAHKPPDPKDNTSEKKANPQSVDQAPRFQSTGSRIEKSGGKEKDGEKKRQKLIQFKTECEQSGR